METLKTELWELVKAHGPNTKEEERKSREGKEKTKGVKTKEKRREKDNKRDAESTPKRLPGDPEIANY